MICGIHQPNFLPYLGFFDKIKKSDVFIIYDDAQFCYRDFHNQNYILLNGKPFKLKIPVEESPMDTPLNKIRIKNNGTIKNHHWKEYHLMNIYIAYHNSPNFNLIFPLIKNIYNLNIKYLVEFNVALIYLFCNLLGISKRIYFSNNISNKFRLNSKSTQKLIDLTKAVKADTYFSGSGGKGYLEEELFEEQKIKLIYQHFDHPIYKQMKSEMFIKNMCVLDYLFNTGDILCYTPVLLKN